MRDLRRQIGHRLNRDAEASRVPLMRTPRRRDGSTLSHVVDEASTVPGTGATGRVDSGASDGKGALFGLRGYGADEVWAVGKYGAILRHGSAH